MSNIGKRSLIAAMSLSLFMAAQFAVMQSAHAKSAKCAAVQVPGKPGTFVVNCSTKRP